MSKLAVILGSLTPPGRLLNAVAAMVKTACETHPGLTTEILNLADFRISFADGRPPEAYGDDTSMVVGRISTADLFILATPVYRASFTGALKNLLDHLPVESLMGKPCGIITMGATAHHFLGADWHLRNVLTWFGALVPPVSVYLASADFADGGPSIEALAELAALVDTLVRMGAMTPGDGRLLGPVPLAARRR